MSVPIPIIAVFGTRPEALKMAPVIARLKNNKKFNLKTVITAQHRKMLDNVLSLFEIKPNYDLNIMTDNQSLHRIAAKSLSGLKKILDEEKPNMVLVQGDTTTALAASLASCYSRVPVGHIEAGLRSYDNDNPFPEEQNRRVIDCLSSFHFAPTVRNKQNLIKENIPKENIFVTGNTVIDILLETASQNLSPSCKKLRQIKPYEKVVLITVHRRENFGRPLKDIFRGILKLSSRFNEVQFIYPVHPNPNVKETALKMLKGHRNILLLPPVQYSDMVWLLKRCYFCLTDSGGLQEEAPSLGKPVGVLRKVTERPEAVEAGTVEVIGTSSDRIYQWGQRLMQDKSLYKKFSKAVNPYGDGNASKRIVAIIEYKFGLRKKKPGQWKI